MSFVNTRITGRIFGGDSQDMQIVSGDTITLPPGGGGVSPVPAPPGLVLALTGIVPGLGWLRFRRGRRA